MITNLMIFPTVIDDRLPTKYDQPKYMQMTSKHEFWASLFEKAYAKLQGSYDDMDGGLSSQAFEDFTGGLLESFSLSKAPDNFYKMLMKAQERNSMIDVTIGGSDADEKNSKPVGLVGGHEYSVTKIHVLDTGTQKIQMVIGNN